MHLPEQARGSRPNAITVKRKIKTVSALFFLRPLLLPVGEEPPAAPAGIPSTVGASSRDGIAAGCCPFKAKGFFSRCHNLPASAEGTRVHPRFTDAAQEGATLLGPAADASSFVARTPLGFCSPTPWSCLARHRRRKQALCTDTYNQHRREKPLSVKKSLWDDREAGKSRQLPKRKESARAVSISRR